MRLTILCASAGSGKTCALTMNYLQLLLKEDSPSCFRSILAGEETFDQREDKKGLEYCCHAGICGRKISVGTIGENRVGFANKNPLILSDYKGSPSC